MKFKLKYMVVAILIFTVSIGSFAAYNAQDELRLITIQYCLGAGMYDRLYAEIEADPNITEEMIQTEILDKGYMHDYIDKFKAAGRISQDYTPPGASSTTTTAAPAEPVAPEPFAVVDCEPYPGWAIKDVNIRSGASTQYDKVGGLSANEEVTVTGVASTGWLRITTKAGTEAYVSNNFITTENPNEVETEPETTVEETTVEEVETVVEETTVEEITSVEETETETETLPEETASEEPVEHESGAVRLIIAVAVMVVLGTTAVVIISKMKKK